LPTPARSQRFRKPRFQRERKIPSAGSIWDGIGLIIPRRSGGDSDSDGGDDGDGSKKT